MLTASLAGEERRLGRSVRAAALGALVLLAAPLARAQQEEEPSEALQDPSAVEVPASGSSLVPEGVGEPENTPEALAPPPPRARHTRVWEPELAPVLPPEPAEPEAIAPPPSLVGPSVSTYLGPSAAVWLEGGFTAGGPDTEQVIGFSPELGVRFRVIRELVAEASFGMMMASTEVRGTGTLGGEPVDYDAGVRRIDPGNPTVRALYSGHIARDLVLETGLALAIPTAARDELGADAPGLAQRAGSEVSYRGALAMRGYWSPWRWAPERFSVAAPLRLAYEIGAVVIDGELGLGLMFPVLGDRGVDIDVVVQLAAGVGAKITGPLSLGVRLRGVGGALGVMVPGVVVSTEPWVGLDFDPVRLTLRANVNLNGDDGVAGDRGPAFGLFLGASVGI